MIVVKFLIVFLSFAVVANAGDDQLLKMGEKHSCIKQVISLFVANKDCNTLDDTAKFNVLLKLLSLHSK